MQIIIPMSGTGDRFLKAGYKEPKPLILVDGKPIIEHVVNLFPGENDLIFICNNDHLKNSDMRAVLSRIAPKGTVIGIETHKKGPVFAVSRAFDLIRNDDEVIVNYCDFSKYWDYRAFLAHTRKRNADGAISAYKGFHPHMLGKTNYAFIQDDSQWLTAIKEKTPFTENRMDEFASDGTYYFRKGSLIKKYFPILMDKNINHNGEYYVSMVYNLMREDGLKTSIYEIEHMLQWGTPRDLEEYIGWSEYFRHTMKRTKNNEIEKDSITLIPLAGKGMRFVNAGFTLPKPLIRVNGKPMIIQAADHLPRSQKNIFVCLKEHADKYPLNEELLSSYPAAKIVELDHVTEGQACTCKVGLENENDASPLLISASDNGVLYDKDKYASLMNDKTIDAVIWSFRRHPSSERNPQMYGWIKVDSDNNVTGVSVKVPISKDPYNDHAIVGTFYFRKAAYFHSALERMIKKNVRVNNEFYVDSMFNELIELGLKVKVFEVDDYICWGTPDDLKVYQYWQSFFHKCAWHPYDIRKDIFADKRSIKSLLPSPDFRQKYE